MRRYWLLLLLVSLAFGCEAPASREPGPEPQEAPARREPKRTPGFDLTQPGGMLALEVDPIGRLRLEGEEVLYLVDALEEEQRRSGKDLVLRLEVAPQAVWRDVRPIVEACRRARVRNLHWRVAADPRPPVAWPIFPPTGTPRSGIVGIKWHPASAGAQHLWRPLPGLLSPQDPEPPRRPLTRAEVVTEVRATRARRVYLQIEAEVPFAEIFDTAEALRDTGTLLAFE
jgi:hypothetical protein